MAGLKTLIVHPDPQVRHALRALVAQADFLKVLGEAVSAEEVLELLEHVPYGVFFLGLDLSGGISGIELAQMLTGRKVKPALVFLAEDEAQAFRAFELGATDYLLWPCDAARLERTFDRLRQFKSHFKLMEPAQQLPAQGGYDDEERTLQLDLDEEQEDHFVNALAQAWDYSQRARGPEIEKLAITLEGKAILVPYDEIIFVEAYEDYSYVHTATQKFLTSYRLKTLEERLRSHRFFRVHRKYLVNLEMVTEIASLPGSNFMLRTAGRTRIELPISRRRIGELKEILGL